MDKINVLNILVNDILFADLQKQLSKLKTTIKMVNTNMLIIAREARSLNQIELAERIRMSPTNLSKIERGDIRITDELLNAIADITGYPQHFFRQQGEIIPPHLSFRKRHKVGQKHLSAINAKANIIGRHVQFLARAMNISQPLLPSSNTNESPQSTAIETRRKWSVASGPISNVIALLEKQGIVIAGFDFETQRVDSKSFFTDDKQPVIFFNNSLLGDRQRFTLAFELGQLVMYGDGNVSSKKNILHEANAFAAEFLMPAKDIKEDFKKGINIPLLAELKKKWKVSMIALLYRADDLDFITPNQKRYLLQQFNQMQIRRREPRELDIAAEQPKLLKNRIASYRKKTKLGIFEMAALLCLNSDEFMELYL